MTQHLETIVELQQALDELDEAERRLHGIPDWMRELHDEHGARQAEIAALEQAAEAAASERRAAEAAIQDAQEKLKKYQQQINRVSTQREYGALLQEIDTVKAQIAASRSRPSPRWSATRRAQQELASPARELPRARRALRRRAGPLGGREARRRPPGRASSRSAIARAQGALPRGIVSQFERIRERYPAGALAPVRLLERPGRRGSGSGTAAPATTACARRWWSRSATAAAWCSATAASASSTSPSEPAA